MSYHFHMTSHRDLDTVVYLKSGFVPRTGEGDSVTLSSEFRQYIMEKPIGDDVVDAFSPNNPYREVLDNPEVANLWKGFNFRPVRLKVENEFPDLRFDFYDAATDWEANDRDRSWSLHDPSEIRKVFECLQQSFFFYEEQMMESSMLFTKNSSNNIRNEFDLVFKFLDTTIQWEQQVFTEWM